MNHKNRRSRCMRGIAAVTLLAITGWAQAQMVDIPLSTVLQAPPTQSGTLSNGVDWQVDYGQWLTGTSGGNAAHYGFRGGAEVQTWTFNVPVNVQVGITGLQGASEGVHMPPGTVCTPPDNRFTWNSTTGVLQHIGTNVPTDGGVVIPCSLSNVTTLSMSGRDSNGNPIGPAGNRRGPNYVRVERIVAPMSAVFSGVPVVAMLPNQTVRPTLTCTNAGPGAAIDATCVPSVTAGGGTVSNITCTPPTPVGVLNAGESIVCEFDLTAPAAPTTIRLSGQAAGGTNTPPPATADVIVQAAPVATMAVAISGVPGTMAPGATANGTVTCTNTGPDATTASTCDLAPLPAGSGTVSNFTCTPASPAPLAAGAAMTCTFTLEAPATPPAGPIELVATAGGGTGPNPTATHQVTVAAGPAGGVQAVPTLQTWALMLMGALVAGLAGWRKRRAV